MIFRVYDVRVGFLKTQTELRSPMADGVENNEDWVALCEQAAVEQDPDKLFILTQEICRLLDEREKRLKNCGS